MSAFDDFVSRLIVALATLLVVTGAHAVPITIFNTGVDSTATVLADGTIGDPHYALVAVPGGTTTIRCGERPAAFLSRLTSGITPSQPGLAPTTTHNWMAPWAITPTVLLSI